MTSDDETGETKKQVKGEVKGESKGSKANTPIILQKEILENLETLLETIRLTKDLSKIRLQTFQNAATSDWESSNKYHKNIIGSTKISETEVNDYMTAKIFREIKENYWLIIAEIAERLEGFKEYSEKPKPCNSTYESEFRLPTATLPSFSGNYEHWLGFNNLFTTTIHNRANLAPVQKLHLLKEAVTGPAFEHIRNFTLTDENYEKAREVLEHQYNHTRKIAHIYMQKLLECDSIYKENARDISKFISNVKDCLASLKSLGLPTDQWDYILLYNLQRKIPSNTLVRWEEELGASRTIPKLEDFLKFLENRFRTLEMLENPRDNKEKDQKKCNKTLLTKTNQNESKPSQSNKSNNNTHRPKNNSQESLNRKKIANKNVKNPCVICNQNHSVTYCDKFRNNTAKVRRELATKYKLCFNCLGSSHSIEVCYSTKTCIYCKKPHHSLLHIHDFTESATTNNPSTAIPNRSTQPTAVVSQSINHYASSEPTNKFKVMCTALVRIVNSKGYAITARAFLDSGAEDNYISSAAVQNAGLQKYPAPTSVFGLNEVNLGELEYRVNFQIQSFDGSFTYDTSASVTNAITSEMPSQYIEPENFGCLNNLSLADPNFNQPAKVQLLLGIEFIVRIRKPGIKRFRNLLAENTLLGWVVMGHCDSDDSRSFLTRRIFCTKSVSNEDLSKQIQKFFEVEDVSTKIPRKPEDEMCEKLFVDSVKRGEDGKLIFRLPFREGQFPVIGPSKHIAMRRFFNLEKKLLQNQKLREEYCKNIQDYLQQGHLLPVTEASPLGLEYFLPHHAVVKDSSTTTKVRVVFDGSCKTEDSMSLNDHLLTGPKLQNDIRDVFFNWRTFSIALTADIAQMYRMFWIDEQHRPYQKILWRFDPEEPIQEYCLATVTFGTSSAPFQAIRALHHIAEKESSKYPLASHALKDEFYVDDFISGAHTVSEAIQKQQELREVLSQYGLNIRKWSSNNPEALQGIDNELKETLTELTFDEEEFRKTLGVYWAPKGDFFSFSTSNFQVKNSKLTKRIVLSLIARLYDPMGWVGPCTVHAKMIMQRIWEQNLNWDEEVCGAIKSDFEKFLTDLPALTDLKIPRWVQISNDTAPLTLYGFSDASLKAYGAVLYLQNPNPTDNKKLILLTSRTRVKPLKHITLARLELCAAVMLSELIDWARKLLISHPLTIHAFSDSKIVLSWIKAHPSKWKMYVASRTTKILESTNSDEWSYVNTKFNPADLVSRGLLPSEIVSSSLWWNGPSLEQLYPSIQVYPGEDDSKEIQKEMKEAKAVLHTRVKENPLQDLLVKYSSHGKMIRVMRYITDFIITVLRKLMKTYPENKDKYHRVIQQFPSPEIQICRQVQRSNFSQEITALNARLPIPKSSSLLSLSPFLDGFGVLRVGGRLQNACISYNQKHPIILPSHHQVSSNLIRLAHHATFHGTKSLTESYLLHKFKILRCGDRIKMMIRSCPKCIRLARENHEQLMGSLPTNRVNPYRPFLCSGVDYAGPFNIKAYKGRCNKIIKGYVSLFVCFATKALHLELVSDLSADAFLAAFRRFVSRRGRCEILHSDCGTNFVKGSKLIECEIQNAQHTWKTELAIEFEEMGTRWEFNPPGSPHFGGLWEAGVKSMKTHLNKTFGTHTFTVEEFNTVLIQIEGILNSRPLCPLNSNPDNFSALTPAHFLIGECIVSPPDRYYELEARHPLDRWQFLQKLKQMFWVSWKKEYLQRLNCRSKWKTTGVDFKKDDIVILTSEDTPATYWPLAIITETHPGRDGITRVVSLKTSKGQILKRPTAKLRLLAFEPKDFKLSNTVKSNITETQ